MCVDTAPADNLFQMQQLVIGPAIIGQSAADAVLPGWSPSRAHFFLLSPPCSFTAPPRGLLSPVHHTWLWLQVADCRVRPRMLAGIFIKSTQSTSVSDTTRLRVSYIVQYLKDCFAPTQVGLGRWAASAERPCEDQRPAPHTPWAHADAFTVRLHGYHQCASRPRRGFLTGVEQFLCHSCDSSSTYKYHSGFLRHLYRLAIRHQSSRLCSNLRRFAGQDKHGALHDLPIAT